MPNKKALRLAYIVGTFPQPSETFIAREIAGLRSRGHEVTIFSLFAPHAGPIEGVQYGWRSAAKRLRSKLMPELSFNHLASNWQITRERFDVAIVHFASLPATVAMQVVAADVPLVISAHARDIYVEDDNLEGKLARAASLITCTQENVAYLRDHYPIFSQKIQLIYHGLPASWLAGAVPPRNRAAQDPLRILAVGRFVEKKGFGILLEACARLQSPYRLTMVGDGPLRTALLRHRDQLHLHDVVEFPGWLDEAALRTAYADADVICSPSVIAADGDRDGLPNVLLEAQSTGLPAISSDISALSEAIIDGHTGLLVPPLDVHALTTALSRMTDPTLRHELGAHAASFVREHYCAEQWLDKLEEILRMTVQSTATELTIH